MTENEYYILALETAGQIPSISLLNDSMEIDFWVGEKNISGSASLIPAVNNILQRYQIKIQQIRLLAVSVGPGSFTGVRIGLATAKGLSFGTEMVCVGVNYLETLALSAEETGKIRCVISSGRDEFFVQDFYFAEKFKAKELTKPQVKKFGELINDERLNSDITIISDIKYQQKLLPNNLNKNVRLHTGNVAKFVGLAGLEKFRNEQVGPETLQPLYIREADFKMNSQIRWEFPKFEE